MATHSSILTWRTVQTEESGGLQFLGHKQSDMTKQLSMHEFHPYLSSWSKITESQGPVDSFRIDAGLQKHEGIFRGNFQPHHRIGGEGKRELEVELITSSHQFNQSSLCGCIFFVVYFYQLETNYFTIVQWFLLYIDMNQPWIYMCSPSRSPLPHPSPSHPSGSSQGTSPEHLSHASNLGWRSVSPLIVYWFQCYSLRTSHLAFSHRVPESVLYICVSFSVLHIRLLLPSF